MNLQINKKNIIYFIGIGGIGMSGIALIMKNLGYNVQGSDLAKTGRILNELKKKKIKIIHGHSTKKILKADGLLATCIQHEMDHLEGILFIDYLSKLKKTMILKKLSKNKSTRIVV